MGIDFKENKGFRLLQLYERLSRGEVVSKAELAQKFAVTDKTIQRDIEELRSYLAETRTDEGGGIHRLRAQSRRLSALARGE